MSLYKGELTQKNMDLHFLRLGASFKALDKDYFCVLRDMIIRDGFTDQRLSDAIDNVIRTCVYPSPTIAQILQFDRKIKLFTYSEVQELVFSGRDMNDFIPVNTGHNKPDWIERINFETSGLKKWDKKNKAMAPSLENENNNTNALFETLFLDIFIDVQNELLRQCKRAECDDYQTDLINENTIAVFNLNKQKYISRAIQIF